MTIEGILSFLSSRGREGEREETKEWDNILKETFFFRDHLIMSFLSPFF